MGKAPNASQYYKEGIAFYHANSKSIVSPHHTAVQLAETSTKDLARLAETLAKHWKAFIVQYQGIRTPFNSFNAVITYVLHTAPLCLYNHRPSIQYECIVFLHALTIDFTPSEHHGAQDGSHCPPEGSKGLSNAIHCPTGLRLQGRHCRYVGEDGVYIRNVQMSITVSEWEWQHLWSTMCMGCHYTKPCTDSACHLELHSIISTSGCSKDHGRFGSKRCCMCLVSRSLLIRVNRHHNLHST